MKVYMGWDPRDMDAYRVCERSMREHASIPLDIVPLVDWKLRQQGVYWRSYRMEGNGQRIDDRDGKPFSTEFSFTRFLVPLLEDYESDVVLFCDPDMLWRADIAGLRALWDDSHAVMCVKHNHCPPETEKMGGLRQTLYHRKNWSSLMMLNPAKCRELTKYRVNNEDGEWLHAMCWASEEQIGGLPEEWNWLEGWSDPAMDPKVVHYTRGTPDLCPDVMHADWWWDAHKGESEWVDVQMQISRVDFEAESAAQGGCL